MLYEHSVSVHPVFAKACTSGVAYTLGDEPTAACHQAAMFNCLMIMPSLNANAVVVGTAGDFAAQTFQGRNIFNIDLSRSLRSGIAGFCIHGPLCHLWIQWMEIHLVGDHRPPALHPCVIARFLQYLLTFCCARRPLASELFRCLVGSLSQGGS